MMVGGKNRWRVKIVPGFFWHRVRTGHIPRALVPFAPIHAPLERGDRELSIRAKIVENGAIQIEI